MTGVTGRFDVAHIWIVPGRGACSVEPTQAAMAGVAEDSLDRTVLMTKSCNEAQANR